MCSQYKQIEQANKKKYVNKSSRSKHFGTKSHMEQMHVELCFKCGKILHMVFLGRVPEMGLKLVMVLRSTMLSNETETWKIEEGLRFRGGG